MATGKYRRFLNMKNADKWKVIKMTFDDLDLFAKEQGVAPYGWDNDWMDYDGFKNKCDEMFDDLIRQLDKEKS